MAKRDVSSCFVSTWVGEGEGAARGIFHIAFQIGSSSEAAFRVEVPDEVVLPRHEAQHAAQAQAAKRIPKGQERADEMAPRGWEMLIFRIC